MSAFHTITLGHQNAKLAVWSKHLKPRGPDICRVNRKGAGPLLTSSGKNRSDNDGALWTYQDTDVKVSVTVQKNLPEIIRCPSKGFLSVSYFSPADYYNSNTGGVSSDKLGYAVTEGIGYTVDISLVKGYYTSARLSGKISISGKITSDIESKIEYVANKMSADFADNFRSTRQYFKSKAGGNYYFFFRGAAEYGYDNTEESRKMRSSSEFSAFSNGCSQILKTELNSDITGNYDINFSIKYDGDTVYDDDGVPITYSVSARAWVYVLQVTMDNGVVLNMLQPKPKMAVRDQNGKKWSDKAYKKGKDSSNSRGEPNDIEEAKASELVYK